MSKLKVMLTDAPKVAIREAPCAQHAAGGSTTRPSEALLA